MGYVSPFAGNGKGVDSDGIGTSVGLRNPRGLTMDSSGNIFVAQQTAHTIKKITSSGGCITWAGTSNTLGAVDGDGTNAKFNTPLDVAVDLNGIAYVADLTNEVIRTISTGQTVTTLAGLLGGGTGWVDGFGTTVKFNGPFGVVVNSLGNLFVTDLYNSRIRMIATSGQVSTFAGATAAVGNGQGTLAKVRYPYGMNLDATGNMVIFASYASYVGAVMKMETSLSPIILHKTFEECIPMEW